MTNIVMKFGGASVASPHCFSRIADIISEKKKHSVGIVIVVSAMGNTTNELITLAKQVHPSPPQREYDMLVSVGERISISLLAMALARKGELAISFTGSQSGIITSTRHSDARIIDVRPHRIIQALALDKIVIVAGFQGVSHKGEITTLGRGGSDTTAVALGAALQAEAVEFYKDVPGVFSADPKTNPSAFCYEKLTYDEAKQVVSDGAQILHPRCIELAEKNQLPLLVRTFKKNPGNFSGTIIVDENSAYINKPAYESEMNVQVEEKTCCI